MLNNHHIIGHFDVLAKKIISLLGILLHKIGAEKLENCKFYLNTFLLVYRLLFSWKLLFLSYWYLKLVSGRFFWYPVVCNIPFDKHTISGSIGSIYNYSKFSLTWQEQQLFISCEKYQHFQYFLFNTCYTKLLSQTKTSLLGIL